MTQTHRQYENITFPHTRAVTMLRHEGQSMIVQGSLIDKLHEPKTILELHVLCPIDEIMLF